jgi:hypothetical protein
VGLLFRVIVGRPAVHGNLNTDLHGREYLADLPELSDAANAVLKRYGRGGVARRDRHRTVSMKTT